MRDTQPNLEPQVLDALEAVATARTVSGGELLIRAGDAPGALYIVVSGRFVVERADGRLIGEIGAGEPIGELSFFAGFPRTASVRAARDGRVLEVTRAAYDAAAARDPRLGQAVVATLCRRLAATTAASPGLDAPLPRVSVLLAGGGAPLPPGFCAELGAALARGGARLVEADACPAEARGDIARWLGELEAQAEAVVLVAGDGDDAWNRAICRNADALIVAAPLGGEPAARSAAEQFATRLCDDGACALDRACTLILWREAGAPIAGTGAWLASRAVTLHHHVVLGAAADFARVARFVTGRAVGIVLAGGGALGCAHLGVMRALREAGVPIDFLGGTSAGAAMAAAVARGLTPDETLDQMEAMFVDARAMKRLTLPIHSLLDPRVFDAQLRERYGSQAIEDLPLGLFAASTSLTHNRLHVHRSGPLWEAVRASGSLPTILPPMIASDGEVLVDGGVLDNIPVAAMRALKSGPNIVVALGGADEAWRSAASYATLRTPLQLLRDVVFRRAGERLPNIVDVLSRAMVVASRGALAGNLAQADVLLSPPLPAGMRILDWHMGRALADAAFEYTMAAFATDERLAALRGDG